MNISNQEELIDEDLFVESHLLRIRHGGPDRLVKPFKIRLMKYSEINNVKLCPECWEVNSEEKHKCQNCGKLLNN